MLEIKNLRISIGGRTLLSMDKHIHPSEILTIMGPSGSGKSTLLACLIGQLDDVFSFDGYIRLNGKDITHTPTEQRNIGMMFQQPLLFPHMTVGENIEFGRAKRRKNDSQSIDKMLDSVGLAHMASRYPHTLSGGQQSRAALLRLLASEPDAVLLDEPFSSLDDANKQSTRSFIVNKLREQNVPVILVTHDESDALAVASKIVRLNPEC